MEVFRQRRTRVRQAIGDGVLVVCSAPEAIRNNDVGHEYRQDSDFYYLTGISEPESVLVLSAEQCVLFLRPRDPEREVWDGRRLGVDGGKQLLGADQAFPISELGEQLPKLLEHQQLYYRLNRYVAHDRVVLEAFELARRMNFRRGKAYPTEIIDADRVLHEMRRRKESGELELMRRAAAITDRAHRRAMAMCRPGMFEYEIEAELRACFRRSGSERSAYRPIVGSGPNATILHYVDNDRQMNSGDLLLIDAGCEYRYYASDVTRTFPVNGRFSAPQREIYACVLAAQEAAIEHAKPGSTVQDVHHAALLVLVEGMIDLGLIAGPRDAALESESYKRYYMHRTSHYLGMDVHDVGTYYTDGQPRRLDPDVVITVEPGLYIGEDDADAPARYRGIGVRIEDDVLITDAGCEVLSASVPKSPSDVEAACGSPTGS